MVKRTTNQYKMYTHKVRKYYLKLSAFVVPNTFGGNAEMKLSRSLHWLNLCKSSEMNLHELRFVQYKRINRFHFHPK